VFSFLLQKMPEERGRGGFGRGFGGRGDGERGRGRGRGDRGRGRGRRGKDEEEKWVPCTKLGRLVQQVMMQQALGHQFSAAGHGVHAHQPSWAATS
jgi:hypothetical protein